MNARALRGFTLLELLIVLGIVSLMLASLVPTYLQYGRSFTRQSALVDVSYSATSILSTFDELARQASAVKTSATVFGTLYTTGSTTLVLEIPSISVSGDVVASTYDYAVIYATSTTCYLLMSPDASSARKGVSKKLSSVLANLTFTYDTVDVSQASIVSADVSTRTTVHDVPTARRLTGNAHLRNK